MHQLRKFSFKIIHSSTIILPRWKAILEEGGLKQKILPQDVSTWWNSMFNMITAFLEYKLAVRKITPKQDNGLCKQQLSKAEWGVVQDLQDVLQVA